MSAHPVDLVALTLMGGAGDDRLIGSPFNDVIDGGTSDAQGDTLTGGLGYDIFRSGNATAVDTLVETQNTDMGLYGNLFVTGVALANNGTTLFATDAGGYATEDALAEDLAPSECAPDYIAAHGRATCDAVQDPHSGDGVLRQPGYGENWRGTIVENITGIFDTARLTAGAGNNTIVVNAIDGRIVTDGQTRTVTPWTGDAVLDNVGNTANALPEYYVITFTPGTTMGVDIVDSGGGSGTDDVVVFGSNQSDTFTLGAAGQGAFAVGFVSTATGMLSFQGAERFELYTLGGNDSILSNDTAVTSVIDMGAGDDSLVVGTVPLIPDPGNRTLEYPNGVPVADTAHMTNGNTAPLYVLGGTQNDYFEVNHNVGMLYLAGDEGDDTFLVNTFLVLKQNPDKPDLVTNLTTLFGGQGSNRYQYLAERARRDQRRLRLRHADRRRHPDRRHVHRHGHVHRGRRAARQLHEHRGDRDRRRGRQRPDLRDEHRPRPHRDGERRLRRRHDSHRRDAAAARVRAAAVHVHAAGLHGDEPADRPDDDHEQLHDVHVPRGSPHVGAPRRHG